MVLRVKKWEFSVLTVLMLLLLSVEVLAASESKKIPKWKLEHQKNVTNSSKVCAAPMINPKVNPRNLTTGFYTVNLRANTQAAYLDVDEDGLVVLHKGQPSNARRWLLTHIGGANYDIATCYQGEPVCLSIGENKQPAIGTCDEVGYGDQTWWLKGYAYGLNKGAWFFGNDGLGQMECLESGSENPLSMQQCNATAWDISRAQKPVLTHKPNPVKVQAALAFPDGADIVQYQCESGSVVEAYYDNENDQVFVRYNDELQLLKAMISASGAKYGDIKQPWGWWTKGQSGSIYQTDDDGMVFIENCAEAKDLAQATAQPERIWDAQDFFDTAVVTDCTDCEEDLGFVMNCSKGNATAEVSVYLNTDTAVSTKQLSIKAEIGDKVYQYPFEAQYYEMIGHHIAHFNIDKHDPLLKALQNTEIATFKVTSDTLKVSSRGRSKAIKDFTAYCGLAGQ